MSKKILYENKNTDNILVRSIISGLLNLLNNAIDYSQVWDDTTTETVSVPWYYNMGQSSERFMQDMYTSFGKECFNDRVINGTFSQKPVGWLTYSGSQIDSSSITNRFVEGTYMKKVDGKLIPYVSFLYSMPLTVNFECKVEADNIISALKIEQAIREAFYKNKTFFVQYRGMRIGCTAGFPEQYNMEKTVEYSFDNANKSPVIDFNIAVETYQPVFDKTTEMERDKVIRGWGMDVYVPYKKVDDGEELKTIKIKDVDNSIAYPGGVPFLISWDWTSKDSDFLPVQIAYIDSECPCEEHIIAKCVDNQSMYIWDIPENFGGFIQPMIGYPDDCKLIHKPNIKIVPNEHGYIDDKSFIVMDRGYIDYDEDLLPITIEYEKEDGSLVIVDGYKFILTNGRLDKEDPIFVNEDSLHKYEGKLNRKSISLIVRYTKNKEISTKIDNILIY